MKTGRLDRRHTGHGNFKFYADFTMSIAEDFVAVREWCWNNFGPSCEMDLWGRMKETRNPKWCWINDDYKMRLYFADDQVFNWFILRWGVK
jgi:hypothetical protein